MFTPPKYASPEKALEISKSNQKHIIIDVRTTAEYKTSHIKNAINIPIENIENEIKHLADKKDLILVYCKTGMRSNMAATKLTEMGYENTTDIGGIVSWKGEIVTE